MTAAPTPREVVAEYLALTGVQNWLDRSSDILAALAAAPVETRLALARELVAAAGYAVVPREATEEMRLATWAAQYRHRNEVQAHGVSDVGIMELAARRVACADQRENDRAAYRAMLAAAEAPRDA